jgi:predicted nuclease of restriction endonuclease-like (RecB) superfamily
MTRPPKTTTKATATAKLAGYDQVLGDVAHVIEEARRTAARSVNAVMTATYWLVGRRIVEAEQAGEHRADYGKEVVERLSADLTSRFGRGFGRRNLFQIRAFYIAYRDILQTPSALSEQSGGGEIVQTLSAQSHPVPAALVCRLVLPWSHYVRLLAVKNENARAFYEDEALRGGWTVRQLDRQVQSQFYERTALSRNKAAMLRKGAVAKPEDAVTPEEELKEPYVLEFLGLKDEYSETQLEETLIRQLEAFLLELGGDFTLAGRQRRLRVGDAWYRVDLLFFHRRLRCLVIIDLKMGKFTHADAGQMHLYLNYAREHWTMPGENPPVGLILCAEKAHAVAKYALDGLPNKVLAAEYRTALPAERVLVEAIEKTKRELETRAAAPPKPAKRRKPK